MDPISISASVFGLVSAGTKIAATLRDVSSSLQDAPSHVGSLIQELTSMTAVLQQLQVYVSGRKAAEAERSSLILLEHVMATLTGGVTTYSKLEAVLQKVSKTTVLSKFDRVKWVYYEKSIKDVVHDLQMYKSSLTLMLTILQCQTQQEAERSMISLCDLVKLLLQSNQDLASRLRAVEAPQLTCAAFSEGQEARSINQAEGHMSHEIQTRLGETIDDINQEPPAPMVRNSRGYFFEEVLMSSRVYGGSGPSRDSDSISLRSSFRFSALSVTSGMSLADIPDFQSLALPIVPEELSNFEWYRKTESSSTPERTDDSSGKKARRGVINRLLKQFERGSNRPKSTKVPESEVERKVFGVSLQVSLRYANVSISIEDDKGRKIIWGYIPIIVAKCGKHLKEYATETENIFQISGNPKNMAELQAAFENPLRYGKSVDMTQYTVHDVACVFARYFHTLPEPLIPAAMYDKFSAPFRQPNIDEDNIAAYLAQVIGQLPLVERQSLVYVLDALAVFGSKAGINLMTPQKLSAIFQRGVLSSSRQSENEDEIRVACRALEFMILRVNDIPLDPSV